MAKYGKIGSLPHELREQLNLRILDNQTFKDILQWLNPLPVVKSILAAKFQGSPVNENNLSEWKTGRGYGQWLTRRDARELADSLVAPRAPEDKALAQLSPDQLTQALGTEYAALLQQLHDQPDSHTLFTRVRQLCADLSRMRRDNFRQEQLKLQQQHLALQQTQAAQGTEEAHRKWTLLPEVRAWLYRGLAPDTMALVDRDRGISPPIPLVPPQKEPNS